MVVLGELGWCERSLNGILVWLASWPSKIYTGIESARLEEPHVPWQVGVDSHRVRILSVRVCIVSYMRVQVSA